MTARFLTADPLASLAGITHGFFTRQGGVSDGIYHSLNCGFGSDDDTAAVAANRARVTGALGLGEDRLCTLYQIHSPDVVHVTQPSDVPQKADALVTSEKGLALGILTADCCPVLFADPHAGVIGAAHAGWRGATQGVIGATVAAMGKCGADPAAISAVIGPTISVENYEVGPDFLYALNQTDPGATAFAEERDGWAKPHFNLPAYVTHRLAEAGVTKIGMTDPQCTYAHDDLFFSFRRSTHTNEPDYGRMIAAIALN